MNQKHILYALAMLTSSICYGQAAPEITQDKIFYSYVKSSGTNLKSGQTVKVDILKDDTLVKRYLTEIKGINSSTLSNTELRAKITAYKDTIKNECLRLDDNAIYSSRIYISDNVNYDVATHIFSVRTDQDLSLGWKSDGTSPDRATKENSISNNRNGVTLNFLNVKESIDGITFPMELERAKQIQAHVKTQTFAGIAMVKTYKLKRLLFLSQNHDYLGAILLKVSFYYIENKKDADGRYTLGEKFHEIQWPSQIESHLNLD
ncbi:MAG: hypothetical protein BGO70_03700 [Bacteroidetes bacterium 43-93]|uniref:hypothetical protein n=1 Tax=uncultured Dysgonomonas sp. TaxID=206096 RepID=UPI0009294B14|nr:hypothetical protein [uncultured Dysgonomonas sp.]MBN9485536.1 hypothetical protein [Bacteroidota bacterium]OJW99074.1 MAG: hypothetical protein BGO70_03700 [Bacteroidetes bacterium 43-93]